MGDGGGLAGETGGEKMERRTQIRYNFMERKGEIEKRDQGSGCGRG